MINLLRLRRLGACVADLCYPGVCAVCREFCDGPGPLCSACAEGLEALAAQSFCPLCGKPVAQPAAACPWCAGRGLYPYRHVLRLGVYKDPLKSLIHAMKYHKRWPLAELLADHLAAQPAVARTLRQADLILAVPLHIRRQIARGFNQAHVLATRLASRFNVRSCRLLKRTRATQTQTHLRSHKARHDNVRGAFALRRPGPISGRHVVVVDDVMTSGATLQAVGRTLLSAKPASLSAIVLAVADPHGRDFQSI